MKEELAVPKDKFPGKKIHISQASLKALYGVDDEEKMYNRMKTIALYAEDDRDAMTAIDKIWDRVYGKPKQSMDLENNVSMDAGIFIGGLKDNEQEDGSTDE